MPDDNKNQHKKQGFEALRDAEKGNNSSEENKSQGQEKNPGAKDKENER